jgi:hypothetical protein
MKLTIATTFTSGVLLATEQDYFSVINQTSACETCRTK